MNEATITISGLAIGYKTKQKLSAVKSNMSADIRQGELTCLLGANGVGKSTLLRTLSTFQPRLGGDISILGKSIDDYSARQLSKAVGVVLTEKPDVKNMTASEMVGLGRSPYTGFWGVLSADDAAIVDDSLRLVGIMDLKNRLISTMSDGERQKVMIAKALAQQTPIILLDEPTAFLDFPSKVEVMQLLRRLASDMGKTIFMSTHDLELALQLADTVWLMDSEGLHVGTPRQLADDGTLSHFVERSGIAFDRHSLSVKVEKA